MTHSRRIFVSRPNTNASSTADVAYGSTCDGCAENSTFPTSGPRMRASAENDWFTPSTSPCRAGSRPLRDQRLGRRGQEREPGHPEGQGDEEPELPRSGDVVAHGPRAASPTRPSEHEPDAEPHQRRLVVLLLQPPVEAPLRDHQHEARRRRTQEVLLVASSRSPWSAGPASPRSWRTRTSPGRTSAPAGRPSASRSVRRSPAEVEPAAPRRPARRAAQRLRHPRPARATRATSDSPAASSPRTPGGPGRPIMRERRSAGRT